MRFHRPWPVSVTRLLGAAAWLVAAQIAAASDESHASPSLFAGDLGNALWTLAIFLLVLFVLGKFAWPPILVALQKREQFIRESLEQAKKDREAAEATLREYEQRLKKAHDEAGAIVEEGRRDAEALKRKIEELAHQEGDAMLNRAKRDIGTARDTAVKELYQLSAELATQIAGRILGKELNAREHERLVAESIDELSRMKPGERN